MLTRLIILAIAMQLLFACAVTQPTSSSAPHQNTLQQHRIANAELDLTGLEEIDALIKLDNRFLKQQIAVGLKAQAASTGDLFFRKLKIDFGRQFISLQSTVDVADNTGTVISATVRGDILLDYSNNQLVWVPVFNQLQISSSTYTFE